MLPEPTSAHSPVVAEHASEAWEPPGGVLIWIVVFLELVTFGAGFGVFMAQEDAHAAAFEQGRELLDQSLAFANTLILLTGGWCMANAIASLRKARQRSAFNWVNAAILSGLGFLILKGFEYAEKIRHGIGFGEDAFFTLYYALTGFHAVHVLVAVVLLAFMALGIRRGRYTARNHFDVESSGIFWHLCDLIWLLLFPILYLI